MRWWMIEKIIAFISIVTENLKRRLAILCVLERLFRNWYLNSFVYLWLCWVFVAAHGLFLVAVRRLLLWWLLLLWSMGSRAWASVVVAAAAAAMSLQSCPTLCNPTDRSQPGSSVPGILQARTLEWVAISFSNAWKRKVKVKSLSCIWLLATPWTPAYKAPPSMGFSRQGYWSGVPLPSPVAVAHGCNHSKVCGMLLDQGSNLWICVPWIVRQILYHRTIREVQKLNYRKERGKYVEDLLRRNWTLASW